MYGLKQAPRAWYERLSKFLIEKGFSRRKIDTTIFIKIKNNNMLLAQIYVDDIILGATNESLCKLKEISIPLNHECIPFKRNLDPPKSWVMQVKGIKYWREEITLDYTINDI